MPLKHVGQISAWLADTDIALLELRGPGASLTLRQHHGSVTAELDESLACPGLPAGAADVVTTPTVGVFLHRHPLHEAPLVRIGERVQAGQAIGLLRIGTLLLPVPAPRSGIIAGVLVAHGTTVDFGTRLFELLPFRP
jgi:acetyl-CoA carboxylase biotin carboxyl carrier protein